MPLHDWSRVSAGVFHAFHTSWITHLQDSLNAGVLPDSYYALAEQRAGLVRPDVLTLQAEENGASGPNANRDQAGGDPSVALADRPPQVALTVTAQTNEYAQLRRTLTIRHATGDRIVALIEVTSPANKDRKSSVEDFLEKALEALHAGYHLLLVDVHRPGHHDPRGMHGAIWAQIDEDHPYESPADKPFTLAAYVAKSPPTAFVEPLALGEELTEMPLFIDRDWYVPAPLEATYSAAYEAFPDRWKRVIEAAHS